MQKKIFAIIMLFVFIGMGVSAQEDPPNPIDQLLQSTVKLSPTLMIEGTGFYIAPNAILTNWHVLGTYNTVSVTKYDDTTCIGKVGYRNEKLDLAIVNVDCEGESLTFYPHEIGQTVYTLGNPVGFPFTLTKGVVSGTWKQYITFDASVAEGYSGSALMDEYGHVVGVVKAVSHYNKFIGVAIPAETVMEFLDDWRDINGIRNTEHSSRPQ